MAETPPLQQVEQFTVDGVDFLPYLLVGYTSEAYASGRQVAKFPVLDQTGTLAVPDLAEVVLVIDGVTEFSGVVWDLQVEQYGDVKGARLYTLQCVDWSFGLDTTLINVPMASTTLEAMLTTVIANASFFGITLDPAQDTGPTLPDQIWDKMTLRQVIDQIVGLQAGWMWAIDPATRYFRAYEPYTITVPRLFDETSAGGSGLFALKSVKNFNRYINDGYVRYGPAGPAYITEHIVGNGTDSSFTLANTYLQMNATGTLTHTISGTPATQTVSEDGTGQWTLNRGNNSLTRNAGAVASGDTVDFEYLAQFPLYHHFIDAAGVIANGTFSTIVTDETITTVDQATAVGDGILRRFGGPYPTISFKTYFGAGFRPLQAVTVHCPSLGITSAAEYLISEVRCREVATRDFYGRKGFFGEDRTGSYFEWSIVAQGGLTIYDWLDELRGAPLSTASQGAAGPPTTGTVSFFPVVQARTKGHTTSDSTSHSIALPGGIAAGNLLVAIFTCDEAPTVTINTGVSGANWNIAGTIAQSTNVRAVVLWKIAQGSDVLELTSSTAQQSSFVSLRITGHNPTTPVYINAGVTSNSSNINPTSLSPAAGQLSYLWIPTFQGDSNVNYPIAAMSGYSNFYAEIGSNQGTTTAIAERTLDASTEDPGAWTNGLVFSTSFTLAIRPA